MSNIEPLQASAFASAYMNMMNKSARIETIEQFVRETIEFRYDCDIKDAGDVAIIDFLREAYTDFLRKMGRFDSSL